MAALALVCFSRFMKGGSFRLGVRSRFRRLVFKVSYQETYLLFSHLKLLSCSFRWEFFFSLHSSSEKYSPAA